MNLQDYFDRIRFDADVRPSPDTLAALLRHHVLNIPFENIDIQLGNPVTTSIEAAFEKIVMRRRGGWCYEHNGLFAWVLSELGFRVTRVAAAVERGQRGDAALANHLCLLVHIPSDPDAVYLADVGFGGSLIKPILLKSSQLQQTPFAISLRQLDDGHWQFGEESGEESMSFDFLPEPADESALSNKCLALQTDIDSSFVLNFVAQQRLPDAHIILRGRVLSVNSASGRETRILQSPDEFNDVLKNTFQLDVPGAVGLWDRIVERHKDLFDE